MYEEPIRWLSTKRSKPTGRCSNSCQNEKKIAFSFAFLSFFRNFVADDHEMYAYFSVTENQAIDLIQQYGYPEEH